ncbi:hypothetical protein EJB05_19051 [Eragrostis curvula]|uniref:SHSP domain-containing protein n=1 Tax=Eragrostis curvula TaxID=38414 RepID=A0A5J9UW93_9POAL|nr:hypothetical protein EJB05_19051 [Eragrostis curvula]
MSSLSSYTLLSRPALSRTRLQPGKQAAAVALPWVGRKLSPLSVCHCQSDDKSQKDKKYNIPPFALVNPGFISSGTDWKIKEEMDRIKLWFDVEKSANKDKLKVDKDKDVLVIKYEDSSSGIPASSLDARILMPNDYKQAEVQTDIEFGVLLVTILKPKPKST